MALVIKGLFNLYNIFEEVRDKRTENYLLAGSPLPMLTIVTVYWLFVKKWGPKFMEHRQPYNLDRIIQVYNLFQVAANGYMFISAIRYMAKHGFNLRCEEIDWVSPAGLVQANLVYMYYIIKITDLLDTIFFILRKKYNQATFLHVYHHLLMVVFTYVGVKVVPGGHASMVGILNTFVHIVMYFYYFLTSFKPELKQSMWWKKHITQLQMAQFGYLMLHFLRPIIFDDCDYPKIVLFIGLIQAIALFTLFFDFYRRAYLIKKKN